MCGGKKECMLYLTDGGSYDDSFLVMFLQEAAIVYDVYWVAVLCNK